VRTGKCILITKHTPVILYMLVLNVFYVAVDFEYDTLVRACPAHVRIAVEQKALVESHALDMYTYIYVHY